MIGKFVFKLVIGGDGGIGKTTLVKVFCDNPFIDQIMTIGIDIHVKQMLVNGRRETLQIWDLSGQAQFRFMLMDFAKQAQGIILGFDMFDPVSFHNLEDWITLFRTEQPQVPIFLIGTKADLGYHPDIQFQMIQEVIHKFDIGGYVVTSAKDNINVQLPFKRIVEMIRGFEPDKADIIFLTEAQEGKSTEEIAQGVYRRRNPLQI